MTETCRSGPDMADGGRADSDRDDAIAVEADQTEADLETVGEALDALDADDLDRAEQLADSLIEPPPGPAVDGGAPADDD